MKMTIAAVAAAVFCASRAAAVNFDGNADPVAQLKADQPSPEGAKAFHADLKGIQKPVPAAKDADCDERNEEGLPLGCPIRLTGTDQRTEDGLPMLEVPTSPDAPRPGDKGTVDFTMNPDKGTVGALYTVCREIGGDNDQRCVSVPFALPQLSYDKAGRKILLGDEEVARYEDSYKWYFPGYFSKDAHPQGWFSKTFRLKASWVSRAGAEPQLRVELVREPSEQYRLISES